MALIKCVECRSRISDLASTCPSCGAPVIAGAKTQPTRKLPKTVVAILVLLGLGVLGKVMGSVSGVPGNAVGNASEASENAATVSADEKAANARLEMAGLAVGSLKRAARDPDSLKIERVFTTMDAKFACIRYRARNGFGGMNREHVVFASVGGDTSARSWNKYCVKGEFSEQTGGAAETLGDIAEKSAG